MNWFLKFVVFALFLVSCASSYPIPVEPKSGAEAARDLESKTVALVMPTETKVFPYCSGVWLSDTVMVTAFHCIDEAEDGKMFYAMPSDVLEDGRPKKDVLLREFSILKTDESHDLALLLARGDLPNHGIAPLSLEPISVGDRVQAMGHTAGLWWSYCTGDVAAIRVMNRNGGLMKTVQSTVPVWKGNSGGGLFDMHGRLLGITSFLILGPPNANFFIHRDHLLVLLNSK